MQNAKCRTDAAEREQRVLAHYAEPRGGKALEEGLMQNAKLKIISYLLSPNFYLLTNRSVTAAHAASPVMFRTVRTISNILSNA